MKITTLCRLALLGAPALLIWPATTVWAAENTAVPPTTPTSDFTLDDVNGTAYHNKTGLTWKRCAEGQSWNSGTCTPSYSTYSWSLALQQGANSTFAGFNDWRLPNQKELNSIVEQRNWSPAINATVFPNTPAIPFWSASPYAPNAGHAWLVAFYDGYDNAYNEGGSFAVRLVRGGQYALLSVTKAGSGGGAVSSNLPGVDCGNFCKGSFANEMYTAGQVKLTAMPDANSDFASWTNCPSASGMECTVSSAGDRTVTATFTPKVVACNTSWSTGALQFKLIGISCDTGTNNTVRQIFGDDLPVATYYNDWYLWKVNPVTNASVGVGLDDVLQPQQQGYWMKTRTNVTVDVEGTATAPPTLEGNIASGCPTNNGCFPSPLTPPDASETKQNNLVGHPFPYAVNWTDMRFVVDGIAYTPSAAQTNNYAAKTFWRYNGSSYTVYDDTTPGASGGVWQRNEGLFVRLLAGAKEKISKLWNPALPASYQPASMPLAATEPTTDRTIMASAGRGKARGEAEQKAHRDAHRHANEGLDNGDIAGREWYVRLTVAAPAEKLEDAGNLLGQLADAQTGFDEHDLPELPPPEFGPFLSLVFPHPEWGQPDADYGVDYHPLSRGRQQDSWTFEIRSNDPGRDLVLSWQGPMRILARSVLVDSATGQTIPAAKGSYPIGALGGGSRAFEWRYNVSPGRTK